MMYWLQFTEKQRRNFCTMPVWAMVEAFRISSELAIQLKRISNTFYGNS